MSFRRNQCWQHDPHALDSALSELDASGAIEIERQEVPAADVVVLLRRRDQAITVTLRRCTVRGDLQVGTRVESEPRAIRLSLPATKVDGSLELNDLHGSITLSGATVAGQLTLRRCRGASFAAHQLTVDGVTLLEQHAYEQTDFTNSLLNRLMELKVGGNLVLEGAVTERQVRIEYRDLGVHLLGPPKLRLKDARLPDGATILWGAGPIDLHRARFGRSTAIDRAAEAGTDGDGDPARPSITTAAHLDADALELREVDLSRTFFARAYNLGKISAVDPDMLARLEWWQTPRGSTLHRRPPWFRRHVIYDELWTRGHIVGPAAGRARTDRPPMLDLRLREPVQMTAKLDARGLEETYRGLRMALEQAGAAPAANELFFAERYWRRKRTRWPRKAIPLGYELVSGHGVRPLRALIALIAVIALAAAGLGFGEGLQRERTVGTGSARRAITSVERLCDRDEQVGRITRRAVVACEATMGERVEFAARSATTVLRPTTGYLLQGPASWIDIALRLLSPALFALFVLALRSRVVR